MPLKIIFIYLTSGLDVHDTYCNSRWSGLTSQQIFIQLVYELLNSPKKWVSLKSNLIRFSAPLQTLIGKKKVPLKYSSSLIRNHAIYFIELRYIYQWQLTHLFCRLHLVLDIRRAGWILTNQNGRKLRTSITGRNPFLCLLSKLSKYCVGNLSSIDERSFRPDWDRKCHMIGLSFLVKDRLKC